MERPFASITTLEGFLAAKGIKGNALEVAKTSNGKVVLVAHGAPVATIKRELQGATAAETVAKLAGINFCFGMPHAGATDQSGRPSLPCLMESKSQWETVSLGL